MTYSDAQKGAKREGRNTLASSNDAGRSRKPGAWQGKGTDTATRTTSGPVQDNQPSSQRPGPLPLALPSEHRPTVGEPCHRAACGHGRGLHDDKGCSFCRCGYFLQADLMTEVRGIATFARVHGNRNDTVLYGWLRVFEGWTHERTHAVLNGRNLR